MTGVNELTESGLRSTVVSAQGETMRLPSEPVALTPEQVEKLNRSLSVMRHDINNSLALIVAALDLIRRKPQSAEEMLAKLADQPTKITASLTKYSAEFEQTLGISRH